MVDVASFEADIEDHVDDVLVQRVAASSYSDSTLRFRVLSNGPRSLLDSEILLVCKLNLRHTNSVDAGAIDLRRPGVDGTNGFVEIQKAGNAIPLTRGASDLLAPLARASYDAIAADADAHNNDARALAQRCWNPLVPGAGKCLAFAERFDSFWKGCSSVVLEINGSTSVSLRPDEVIDMTSMILIPPQERDPQSCTWPGGPPDAGCNGQHIARAFRMAGLGANAHFEEFGIDKNFAARCNIFQDRQKVMTDANTIAANEPTVPTGYTQYTLVTRLLPLGPLSYYRNGMGSNRRGMIPYISSLNLLINMKPNPFMHMFQCSAVQGSRSAGGYTISGPTLKAEAMPAATARVDGVANDAAIPLMADDAESLKTQHWGAPAQDADSSRTQVPGFNGTGDGLVQAFSTVKFAEAPFLICRWVAPSAKYKFAPTYSFENTRYVVYTKRDKLEAAKEIRFDQIKAEALPKLWMICCRPVAYTPSHVPSYVSYRGGRFDCSYAETYDCLEEVDEGYGTSLQITCNERSGLMLSYTLRELYAILKKLCPNYQFSYEEWKTDKQLIVLSPAMVPTPAKSSTYVPTTFSIKGRWQRSKRHAVNDGANGAVTKQEHEVRLVWVYSDSITISSSAASTQSFLVSEQVAEGRPSAQTGPAADGLARET